MNWSSITEKPTESGLYCVLLEPNIMTVGSYSFESDEWKLSGKLENPMVIFYLQIPDLIKQIQDPETKIAQQLKRLDAMNAVLNRAVKTKTIRKKKDKNV